MVCPHTSPNPCRHGTPAVCCGARPNHPRRPALRDRPNANAQSVCSAGHAGPWQIKGQIARPWHALIKFQTKIFWWKVGSNVVELVLELALICIRNGCSVVGKWTNFIFPITGADQTQILQAPNLHDSKSPFHQSSTLHQFHSLCTALHSPYPLCTVPNQFYWLQTLNISKPLSNIPSGNQTWFAGKIQNVVRWSSA